jgi:membrane-bound inhibitor of C-type lysozyme
MKNILAGLVVLALIIAGAWDLLSKPVATTPVAQTPAATAQYSCSAGNSITAQFYNGTSTPVVQAGQPPVPTGSVQVALSDGRQMTLRQTISADGTRYANADESFVFWSKGNGALVLENNQEKTYIGCVTVVPQPTGSNVSQVYSDKAGTFSVRYPAQFTVDEAYKYTNMGPGKTINGVKFTIDPAMATGTNLSSDTYINVEQIPQATTCSAAMFLDKGMGVSSSTVVDNGTTYSVATTTGAGAGNRYEETVYALPGTNPCVAVRYMVHYGVLDNYPAGSVKQFNQTTLLEQFDQIRRTLIVNQ